MIARGRVYPQRTCDKCGAQRRSDEMRVITGRWICNWHDHFIAPETLDKLPLRTFRIKAFKGAKPFAPRDTYEKAENEVISFLLDQFANAPTVDAVQYPRLATPGPATAGTIFDTPGPAELSTGVHGAGWTAIYLYELITENARPIKTVNQAKTALKAIADWLLTRIFAYPGRPGSSTSASLEWGGFEATGGTTLGPSRRFNLLAAVAGGTALLRAYQIFGTPAYLDAARATIWFVRSLQCGGMLASGFSSTNSAGTARVQWGTFATYVLNVGGTPTMQHQYFPRSLLAVEFYDAFRSAIGDEIIGSSDTAGAFSLSRETTISAAIDEAKAFWATPVMDAIAGVPIAGFSSATPREYFFSWPVSAGGNGSWGFSDAGAATGTTITGWNYAAGLRGLRAVDGDSAFVTGLFDWLMTFTSNPLSELPATPTGRSRGYSDRTLYATGKGTADPTVAMLAAMQVRATGTLAATKINAATSGYDLGAGGLIAGLFATRQGAGFKALKDNFNTPRDKARDGLEDGIHLYLPVLGRCGLSFQPQSNPAAGVTLRSDIYGAAQAGLVYRESPTAFNGRGHA